MVAIVSAGWCRRLVGRGRRGRGRPAAASILGVAVNLLLALAGGQAALLAAADDAAIGIANAGAQTAKGLAVVSAPAPDAAKWTCGLVPKMDQEVGAWSTYRI